jgi:hypothetical protein
MAYQPVDRARQPALRRSSRHHGRGGDDQRRVVGQGQPVTIRDARRGQPPHRSQRGRGQSHRQQHRAPVGRDAARGQPGQHRQPGHQAGRGEPVRGHREQDGGISQQYRQPRPGDRQAAARSPGTQAPDQQVREQGAVAEDDHGGAVGGQRWRRAPEEPGGRNREGQPATGPVIVHAQQPGPGHRVAGADHEVGCGEQGHRAGRGHFREQPGDQQRSGQHDAQLASADPADVAGAAAGGGQLTLRHGCAL